MANAEQTAQGLASLGRYGDSMMVHMNPNEVAGLQQLAEVNGSTLTINPDTGMPEAFLGDFINSLLPTAAGIAGGAVGGPAGAAAAGALTSYAQGKRDPLELAMAGLSGYGGGQIGSALGAGGTQALAGTAEAASGAAAGTAEAAAAQTFNAPVSNVMGANQMANVSNFSNIPTAQINQANNLQHLSNKNLTVPVEGRPDLSPFSQAGGQGYSPFEVKDTLMESSVSDLAQDPFVNNQYFDPIPPKVNESMMQVDSIKNSNFTPVDVNQGRIMGPGGSTISTGPAYLKKGQINPVNTSVNNATSFQADFTPKPQDLYKYEAQTPLEKGLNLGERAGDGLKNLKAAGSGIKDAFNNPTDFLERLGGKEYYDASGQLVNEGGKGSALYGGIKLGAPIAMAGVEGYYSDMYDGMNTPITRGGPSGPLNLSDAFRPSMTLPMYARGGIVNGYAEGGDTSKPALNLNNVTPNYTAGTLNLNTGSNTPPEEAVVNAIVSAGQNVGGSSNQPFSVPTKFIAGQGNVPQDYRGGIAPNYTQDIAGNFRSIYAQGGMIPSYQAGGIAGLGYGGLLEGEGDGISDSIPARIDGSQEAALSKGEFVVPARIVSEIGNGSSDAGAERLYAMMDRVEKDRERTTGQGNIAVDTNAERRLPA